MIISTTNGPWLSLYSSGIADVENPGRTGPDGVLGRLRRLNSAPSRKHPVFVLRSWCECLQVSVTGFFCVISLFLVWITEGERCENELLCRGGPDREELYQQCFLLFLARGIYRESSFLHVFCAMVMCRLHSVGWLASRYKQQQNTTKMVSELGNF